MGNICCSESDEKLNIENTDENDMPIYETPIYEPRIYEVISKTEENGIYELKFSNGIKLKIIYKIFIYNIIN
jgi:hypothetical protein